MKTRLLYLLLAGAASLLEAQTPAVPMSEVPAFTVDLSNYKFSSTTEAGYRFGAFSGDEGLYRSNANYGNGLRLLSSTFNMNSTDGHGNMFDTLQISTQGLGNDPYEVVTARIEKNQMYEYDGMWRRSEYYNPFQNNGESGNLMTTQRDMQDHNLIFTATKWLKLRVGYSRNDETGPAVSNYELYIAGIYPTPTSTEYGATHGHSELKMLQNTRRDSNDYRFGADFAFKSFHFSVTRQLSYYKEDSEFAPLVPGQPYPEPNTTVASSYRRSEPMHIQSPTWFGNLSTIHKLWTMNARISYMKSDATFNYAETGTGLLETTAAPNPVTVNVGTYMLNGTTHRPYVSGDYSFSFTPTDRLTIVSDTSALHNLVDGAGQMLQTSTNAATGAAAVATKNILWNWDIDVGRFSESLDLNYRAANWLGLTAGYLYTDRSVDQTVTRSGTTNSVTAGTLLNHLNLETVGFHLRPWKPLSIGLDAGIGHDNGPYTPESLANYHTIRGRIDYRLRRLRVSGVYRQLYNLNAPVQFSYDTQHSRTITGSSSFEIRGKWWLDGSYSKLHQDAFSALYAELPAGSPLAPPPSGAIVNVRGYNSVYISNVHSASLMIRTQIGRATVSAGYNLTDDTGDGRALQNLGLTNVATAYLASMQTFPMKYQAPLARLSIKITPKLHWNAGWEFYRYNQQFAFYGYQPYYRAQTGYTSLSWTM